MQLTSRLHRPAQQSFGIERFLSLLISLDSAYRQRQRLTEMDAAQRADLGLSQPEIARELGRPIWNAPQHWIR